MIPALQRPPLETLRQAIDRVRLLPPNAPESARTACLMGIVTECSLPRPTRGSDHVVNLRILDASSCDGGPGAFSADGGQRGGGGAAAVELIVFAPSAAMMPQAAAPADVILLSGVLVQFWGDRPQLMGRLGARRSFGYALFGGAAGAPDIAYRAGGAIAPTLAAAAAAGPQHPPLHLHQGASGSAPGGWRVGAAEAAVLAQLRSLAASHALTGPGCAADEVAAPASYLRKVMDLRLPPVDEGATAALAQAALGQQHAGAQQQQWRVYASPEVVDVRCQVLAVDRRSAEEAVIFVWDSTDARPMPRGIKLPPSRFRGREELRCASAVYRLLPLAQGEPGVDVVAELPPLGTALPVLVPQPRGAPARQLPGPGEWVKLRIVGLSLHDGQLALVAGACSRVMPVGRDPHFDGAWATRLARGDTAMWATRPLTRCPRHRALPLVTVRQVLQRRLDGASGTFRLLVRLLGFAPRDPRDMAVRCGKSGKSGGGKSGDGGWSWTYAGRLGFEDATGRLDALLLGPAGEQLTGVPAGDVRRDPAAAAALTAAFARLAHMPAAGVWDAGHGGGDGGDGCAWLEVVVTSAYSVAASAAAAEVEAAAAAAAAAGSHERGGAAASSAAAAHGGDEECLLPGVSEAAGAALAAAPSCVYILHDTFLDADALMVGQ